jgi:hypothetical protein
MKLQFVFFLKINYKFETIIGNYAFKISNLEMEIKPETIFNVEDIPISHTIISTSLTKYNRVNDKISYMLEKEELTKIQRGLYVFNKVKSQNPFLNYIIANTLYGPSYVSRFSALSYYGLLSEQSVLMESMSLSRYREYDTPVGAYAYFRSSKETFPLGISSLNANEYSTFLMATPEKALCDIIWTEKSLPITTLKELTYYLEEDLRFDMSFFNHADKSIFEECYELGNKKNVIELFLKYF